MLPVQASRSLTLQQLSCMGQPHWAVSALASRRLSSASGGGSSAAAAEAAPAGPAAQVLPAMQLPPSASSFAYYRLHPPDTVADAQGQQQQRGCAGCCCD